MVLVRREATDEIGRKEFGHRLPTRQEEVVRHCMSQLRDVIEQLTTTALRALKKEKERYKWYRHIYYCD